MNVASLSLPVPAADLDEILRRGEDDIRRWAGARLLITGGTGFGGRWLTSALLHADERLDLGLRLVVVTRSVQRAPVHPAVDVVVSDVRDLPPLGSVDAVIAGAASSAAAPGTEDAAPAAIASTVLADVQQALRAATGGRLLLLSSGAVYGSGAGRPMTETDRLAPNPSDPRTTYGQAKRLAETLCAAAAADGTVETVAARIFTLIGPRLPLDAHFAAGTILDDVLAQRPIRILGDGTTVRSYLYAADLVVWLWRLLGSGRSGTAYNVGSPDAVTIRELAELAATYAEPPVPVHVEGRPGLRSTYLPDVRRAADELGLAAWTSLPEAVERTLAYHRGRSPVDRPTMRNAAVDDAVQAQTRDSDHDLRGRLDRALRTPVIEMRARDEQRWAAAAGSLDRMVLVGCAELGRNVLTGLRSLGVEPLAFADNDPAMQGKTVAGLSVLSPADAVAVHGTDAVFVATLYNPRPVLAQLAEFGCTRVAPYTVLYRALPKTFLPYLSFTTVESATPSAAALHDLLEHFEDPISKRTLVELVEWWATGDSSANSDPRPRAETYLAPDLFTLGAEETYVDCGAFDGDSIVEFLRAVDGRAHAVLAVEPDPQNAALIVDTVERGIGDRAAVPPLTVRSCALGAADGTMRFAASNTVVSQFDQAGNIEVHVRRLDDVLGGSRPTYLKADVEGGELELLDGASETIARGETIWALTCYHAQDHLWQIPARFLDYADRYTFHLRRYADDCWETVFYAVPRSRSLTVPPQRKSAA